MAEPAFAVPLFSSSVVPLGMTGAAWFNPALAAAAVGRLQLAAQTKTPAVFLPGELRQLAIVLAVNATALRFALPRPSLPVYAIDGATKGEGVADPRTGKGAVILDPFGPILGRSDDRSYAAHLAACAGLRRLRAAKPTSAPAVDVPGLPGGFPPIEGWPGGGEKLGVGPAVVVGIAAAALVVGGVAVWYFGDKRAEMDAKSAIETNDGLNASHLEIERMKLEIQTGKTIAPSPISLAYAEKVKAGAQFESGKRWLYVGVGAAVGVGVVAASNYGAKRLGLSRGA